MFRKTDGKQKIVTGVYLSWQGLGILIYPSLPVAFSALTLVGWAAGRVSGL